ncbi:MAG: prolipoprotein diacylglyceryl transferase [Chloroflexi bacterium]|nr:prolipoprotein diacylglyceryl transferase [Chloroflexota bacterium]
MIEIYLDPILFRLGPLAIAWHGLLTAVGLVVGMWVAVRLIRGSALTADDIYAVAVPVVLGGIVGARLLFVLENWWLFADQPLRVLAINEGGISIYGGVIGGSLVGALYAAATGRPVAFLADRGGIVFLIGQGIGRIGDIINGEHHGREAPGLPWSVVYTHPNTDGEVGVPVHPAVAYEMLYDLAAAALLLWFLRRGPKEGLTYVAAMFLYSLGRLWVGFFRKDMVVAAGLGMAQLIGVTVMIAAIPWFLWLLRRPSQKSRAQRRRAER